MKLRGFRIELTEIDHHLSTFPGVQQAIAIVHKDSLQQQHLVAYISPASTDITKLRQHAAQFLPKHMVPETFVLLDEFPRLPNGKADRNSLPEPQYGSLAEADYVAPANELEKSVSFSCQSVPTSLQPVICRRNSQICVLCVRPGNTASASTSCIQAQPCESFMGICCLFIRHAEAWIGKMLAKFWVQVSICASRQLSDSGARVYLAVR